MEDVLEVYQRPYDRYYPQICLDETSKELRSTPRGTVPAKPGQPQREDYEYKRQGTCSLFLAVEPLAGRRFVWTRQQRTKLDMALVLKELVDEHYPEAVKIILVVDNLNTHHPACLYERFPPEEAKRIAAKLEWHYTPTHGSWLNMAECELSVLARQCLKQRLPDIASVKQHVQVWQDTRNQGHHTINWRFTTKDARIKLKRLYPIVNVQDSI